MSDNDFDLPQLNDPKVAEKIRKSLQDISDQMTMKEGYQSAISEAIKVVAEEHDIPKKVVRALARAHHRQTFQTEVEEHEVFEEAYTKIFGDE